MIIANQLHQNRALSRVATHAVPTTTSRNWQRQEAIHICVPVLSVQDSKLGNIWKNFKKLNTVSQGSSGQQNHAWDARIGNSVGILMGSQSWSYPRPELNCFKAIYQGSETNHIPFWLGQAGKLRWVHEIRNFFRRQPHQSIYYALWRLVLLWDFIVFLVSRAKNICLVVRLSWHWFIRIVTSNKAISFLNN